MTAFLTFFVALLLLCLVQIATNLHLSFSSPGGGQATVTTPDYYTRNGANGKEGLDRERYRLKVSVTDSRAPDWSRKNDF